MISLIRLLLVYDQQMHTCLLSDHQRILINFMYDSICDELYLYIVIKYSHYISFYHSDVHQYRYWRESRV